jgi:2-oxoisovalerate dehydrogenase E1 component
VRLARPTPLAPSSPGRNDHNSYSPDVDPTAKFDTEDDPQFSGNETTMVDLPTPA